MDQGLAGVVGAAVGVAGAVGSAALTLAFARAQARQQGRIDHGRQLRNDRRGAYAGFLEAAQPVDGVLHLLTEDLVAGRAATAGPEPTRLALGELDAAVGGLQRAQTQLSLLGPKPVADEAVRWWSDLRRLRLLLETLPHREETTPQQRAALQQAIDAVESGRERFVSRAREVLETAP